MLTVRRATALDGAATARARTIERAVAGHPLAGAIDGTVIVGVGGTALLRHDDARPRVLVVLAGDGRATPLALANAARADALVLAERDIAPALRAVACDTVIEVDRPDQVAPPFLGQATPRECGAAWRTVEGHPELAQALGHTVPSPYAVPADAALRIADAVVEAVVAAARNYTGAMEPPVG